MQPSIPWWRLKAAIYRADKQQARALVRGEFVIATHRALVIAIRFQRRRRRRD